MLAFVVLPRLYHSASKLEGMMLNITWTSMRRATSRDELHADSRLDARTGQLLAGLPIHVSAYSFSLQLAIFKYLTKCARTSAPRLLRSGAPTSYRNQRGSFVCMELYTCFRKYATPLPRKSTPTARCSNMTGPLLSHTLGTTLQGMTCEQTEADAKPES